jgi:hypothetical protein
MEEFSTLALALALIPIYQWKTKWLFVVLG